ncbi:MAG: phosphatidate cytidylyltransferase [Geminicoccaceae bacterium]
MALPQADRFDPALTKRVLSGVVLVAIALGDLWLGGWLFAGLVILAVALMADEWAKLAVGLTGWPQQWVRVSAILFPVLAIIEVMQGRPDLGLMVLAGGVVIASGAAALAGRGVEAAAAGVVYLGLPAVALIWLRNEPGGSTLTVLWLLLVVWTTDIGAYFVGRTIGGPKLAPSISPGKTWAGLVGGMTLAALVGAVVSHLGGGVPWLGFVAGAVLAVIAQIGDLYESHLKRRAGTKDSGILIPGHGGVLDRLDGLLFAAPAYAFLLYAAGPRLLP